MKYTSRQHGFTLIELLLYVAIVGSLLMAVSAFYASTIEARVKTESITEVEQQGEAALNVILRTIRNADSITSPASAATASSLTLVVPTVALSPTVIDLNSGALRIKEGAGAAVALTDSKVTVTNLTVKNLTRSGTLGTVQVSFTIARINAAGRNEYSYQEVFAGTGTLR